MLSILHTWRRPFIRPIIFNYRAFHCLPWPNLPSAAQPLPITLNFIWHWTPKNTKRLLLLVEKKWIGEKQFQPPLRSYGPFFSGTRNSFLWRRLMQVAGDVFSKRNPLKANKNTDPPRGRYTTNYHFGDPDQCPSFAVLVCWFSCLWHVAYWCIKLFRAHEVVIFINRSCSYVSFFF